MRNRSPYIAALLAALSVASLTYGQVEDPKEVSKDVARDIQKLFVSEYKSKDAKHRHENDEEKIGVVRVTPCSMYLTK